MAAFTDYGKFDALDLAKLIQTKEVSAEEVLEAAIERVEAVDGTINAVVYKMYDEARKTIAAGLPDGPLAGVPFMLKDLGVYYAGAPTTAGSRLFADFVPDHDSTIVERYRAAGLVIMGKTNSPEYGICATTEPRLHGPTRNPWATDRSAGGSSGGAAAAVAAGMLPMAHATDGGGSIRIPAANCGLFGLKPTRARTPAGPDLGEGGGSMSTGHCVSRSVRDSAALLDATHGPAPGDPYSAPPPDRPFLAEVGADPGRLRIAVMTGTLGGTAIDPACVTAVEQTAKLCAELGHSVEPAMPAIDQSVIRRNWRVIIGCNLWNTLTQRAAALGRDLEPDDVEPITWAWAQEGRTVSGSEYALEIQAMHRTGRELAVFFTDYDILLSATMAKPPIPLGVMDMASRDLDDYFDRLLMDEIPITPLFNESGAPAMSVPLHWTDDGLPVGVHFGAAYGGEATLLRLAAQLEEAQPWAERRPPV